MTRLAVVAIIATLGLLTYALAGNAKAAEAGRIVFAFAFFTALLLWTGAG